MGKTVLWFGVFIGVLASVLVTPVWAGFSSLGVGARPGAMGGAFVGLADDAQASFWNPAGLSQLRGMALSSFYTRLYGLTDLVYGMVAVAWGGRWGGLGMAYSGFGNALYRETVVLAAYGGRIAGPLAVGFSLRGLSLSIAGYGHSMNLGIDTGLLVRLSTQVYWGTFLGNVNRPALGKSGEAVPFSWQTGLVIGSAQRFRLTADLYREAPYLTQLRFGHELYLTPHLMLRVGLSTRPSRFSAGMGLVFVHWQVDYAFVTHMALGLTHLVSVGLRLPAKGVGE